ncbi:TAXI family TRAP transporter solute-binding subunit [Leptolyngbya sp. FACHB-261]|uniref:TAXI family TRAP transporter solute-binding subunit n=1 Tax=Leptolyngbya sp. FACHB-261 TaxID=2692806 RepID=UPI001685DA21|nr:TAXI family TRAP transporter solute-binding subunit [Leptolyngbya sp. FACHB-261]MBD2101951.1 TAXI family TRAP transporter solute-binding subunit [Leptolyngbya sp. FACHB-261]
MGPLSWGGLLLSFLLSSCAAWTEPIKLSSGEAGSYKALGQQISHSAQAVGDLQVQDAYNSPGSKTNLERLLRGETDFALVQLDLVRDAIRKQQRGQNQPSRGPQLQTVAVLANEYVHVITQANSRIRTVADLQGQQVALGAQGTGIRFTSSQLLTAANVSVIVDEATLADAFKKLKAGKIAALVYVGSLGTSGTVRAELNTGRTLRLVPIQRSLANYLTVQNSGSYQSVTIPAGAYRSLPPLPPTNLLTLSTATVLVTRADVDREKVSRMTWALMSTAQEYLPFFDPTLAAQGVEPLLREGLVYVHPGAQAVFDYGDPGATWLRYWQQNQDLQAGAVILVGTSAIGLFVQWLRRRQSRKLIAQTYDKISQLQNSLQHNPQEALVGVEDLRQAHLQQSLDGQVAAETYEQLERITRAFEGQCRTALEQQQQDCAQNALLLVDQWQSMLLADPNVALKQLEYFQQSYQAMFSQKRIDLQTYLRLRELILMSLMLLNPKLPARTTPATSEPSTVDWTR